MKRKIEDERNKNSARGDNGKAKSRDKQGRNALRGEKSAGKSQSEKKKTSPSDGRAVCDGYIVRDERAKGGARGEKIKTRLSKKAAKSGERDNIGDKYHSHGDGDGAGTKEREERVRKRKKTPSKLAVLAARLGKTEFFVRGESGVRAMVAVSKICRVSDVKTDVEGVRFKAPSKVCDKIVALLNNLCYDYKIIGISGCLPTAARLIARAGLVAGIALSAAIIAVYPQFITRVSVAAIDGQAIDGALNLKVQAILTEHGAYRGARTSTYDGDAIEQDVLSLDGVSYVEVKRKGTHVYVYLKKELPKENFVDISGSTVRASKTAIVTRVVVEGGTAAVKYGDVVREGDPLIEGYTLYGDDKIPTQARGVVYGITYLRSTVRFDDVEMERVYGATKKVTKLSWAGKAAKAPKSPFENCEIKTTVFSLGDLIPLTFTTYEFREYVEVERRLEADDEQLVKRVYSSLIEQIDGAAQIKNVYSGVARDDRGRTVTVTLEVEAPISA